VLRFSARPPRARDVSGAAGSAFAGGSREGTEKVGFIGAPRRRSVIFESSLLPAANLSPQRWAKRLPMAGALRSFAGAVTGAASRLPVAVRKASLRWRGFITSVANRNLRAMSFYRKEEARNVARFLPRPSHPPLLPPFASSSPRPAAPRRAASPLLGTVIFFFLRGSFSSLPHSPFDRGVLLPWRSLFPEERDAPAPLCASPPPLPPRWTPPIEASLFADNLAERKSRRRARSSGEQRTAFSDAGDSTVVSSSAKWIAGRPVLVWPFFSLLTAERA